MFPSSFGGVGGSGGVDRSQPRRGPAHPYLDSVPPPSTGAPLFPSYAGRPGVDAENSRNGSTNLAEGRGSGAAALRNDADDADDDTCFREEDRMLLRLLYHQQQALQVQLNTMTEWLQQVSYRMASIERQVRASRSTASTAAPSGAGPRSYFTHPLSRSTSAAEGHYAPPSSPYLASQPRSSTSAEYATASGEAPRMQHPSGPASAHSGRSHPASSALAVSSVLEGSRACTPPSEQTRHNISGNAGGGGSSAVPSTTRSFESAVAAPWDPHNASQQSVGAAAHSRTSSHTSALGRQANPLLNSSGVRSKLPAPAANARQLLSRLDASGLSGTAATTTSSASIAAASFDGAPAQIRQPPVVSPPTTATLTTADAVVPPYRRVPADYATATGPTRQPLSRASAVARHAPPASALAEVDKARSGREGTLPPPSHSAATSSVQDDSQGRPGVAERGATVGASDTASTLPPPPPPPPAVVAVHADPTIEADGRDPALRSSREAPPRMAADDDSLSDGYGSYESRMYMKSLGLL